MFLVLVIGPTPFWWNLRIYRRVQKLLISAILSENRRNKKYQNLRRENLIRLALQQFQIESRVILQQTLSEAGYDGKVEKICLKLPPHPTGVEFNIPHNPPNLGLQRNVKDAALLWHSIYCAESTQSKDVDVYANRAFWSRGWYWT